MTPLQRPCPLAFCVFCLVFLITILPTQARELHVSTAGRDDATCGDAHRPCRSIGQAHANASEGDAVIVGPGQYGDVNGDGDFADPGEEGAEVKISCHCLINIEKQITVESSAGPAKTVINAGDRAQSAVRLQASHVNFGRAGRGFTVTHASGPGIMVGKHTTGVRVVGNTIRNNRDVGIEVNGNFHLFVDNVIIANGKHGIMLFPGKGHEIRRNVIRNNGAGGIHTLTHEIQIAENTLANNNPERGCDLINNSTAELLLSPNVWGTVRAHVPGSPPAICNQGGSRTTLISTVQQ